MGKKRVLNTGKNLIEYDEDRPCNLCGEPIIVATEKMICESCARGRCRYCFLKISRNSKSELVCHMEWHRKNTPDIVERINEENKALLDILDSEENYSMSKVCSRKHKTIKTKL